MIIQIPKRKVEPSLSEVFVNTPQGIYAFQRKIGALQTSSKINLQNYALMQEGDIANSAISMAQGFNGKNYDSTHVLVLKTV